MLVTILETAEQVDAAPAGTYVTRSGLDAYYPIKALIEVDQAIFRGEVFDEDGRHVILVELGHNPNAKRNGLSDFGNPERTMSMGPEAFTAPLRDYSEWPIKWWREAVQNSVDGGARNIDLTVTQLDDGTWQVACDDDGRGMDEDTLINKFLMFGGTTKTGEAGATGGFGEAKKLLILPWIGWRVTSRDRVVYGAGNTYRLEHVPTRLGTRLEVLMPADKTTNAAMAISFLEKCYIPNINFTVNGKPIRANLHGGNLIADVPGKALIYFIENAELTDAKQYYMYIRVHGIWMFSEYVGDVPGQLITELTLPSIEVLTSNRDGFRKDGRDSPGSQIARAINELTSKIAKDSLSALRNKAGLVRKKYEGTGKFKARQLEAELLDNIGPQQTELTSASLNAIKAIMVTQQGPLETISSVPSGLMSAAMLDLEFTGAEHIEAALKQLVWTPDFYVANDIENWTVPAKFYPETMTPRVFKLAKTWTELVRFVMMQLGSTRRFGVGFIFSRTTGAQALKEEGESWVMLNPFKDYYERKAIWSPAQNNDLKWLYALAIHECTHVADNIEYHDESFAAAMTMNMAKCADGFRKIRQIAGGIRGRGTIHADED